jgi:2,4-dienoyl-CoA reductase-like NADH-dependent reductase (Old Yellow Enzyme family)
LIPRFDGAILFRDWKEALWDKFIMGSATTTHAVRAAIQRSQASLAKLSREFGMNPKTVAKWRKRATVEDKRTGPTELRSTVLTEAEEAMVVAFRCHTLLPLDDCR